MKGRHGATSFTVFHCSCRRTPFRPRCRAAAYRAVAAVTGQRFEKLGLHRKQNSGLNIWTCEVKGPRKSRRVHGYLLTHPGATVPDIAPDNAYLQLQNDKAAEGATKRVTLMGMQRYYLPFR